jgi:hypothetical protein
MVVSRAISRTPRPHDEPHESIQQRQINFLVDLRRVTIATPPRLTRRRSRGRVDGVEGSTTRSDAVDAYFKFGNVPRKTLTQHFFQLRLEHHHALSSLGNPHLLQIVHALAPLVHQ